MDIQTAQDHRVKIGLAVGAAWGGFVAAQIAAMKYFKVAMYANKPIVKPAVLYGALSAAASMTVLELHKDVTWGEQDLNFSVSSVYENRVLVGSIVGLSMAALTTLGLKLIQHRKPAGAPDISIPIRSLVNGAIWAGTTALTIELYGDFEHSTRGRE